MKRAGCRLALLFIFLVSICSAWAGTHTFRWQGAEVMKVNFMQEYPESVQKDNWGGASWFNIGYGGAGNKEYRGLLQPLGLLDSLSGLESVEAISASCSLAVEGASDTMSFYVYRLIRPWDEGIGTVGQEDNCCWDSAADGVAWTLEGGDFAADIVDSFTVPGGLEFGDWFSFDLKSYVDSVAAGAADYGVIVIPKDKGMYGPVCAYFADDSDGEHDSLCAIISVVVNYGEGLSPMDGVTRRMGGPWGRRPWGR